MKRKKRKKEGKKKKRKERGVGRWLAAWEGGAATRGWGAA